MALPASIDLIKGNPLLVRIVTIDYVDATGNLLILSRMVFVTSCPNTAQSFSVSMGSYGGLFASLDSITFEWTRGSCACSQ